MKERLKTIIVTALACLVIGIAIYLFSLKPVPKIKNFEKERKTYIKNEMILKKKSDSLASVVIGLNAKRISDSLYYSKAIQVKDIAITNLNKRINEVSFKNASVHDLDSIRIALYGKRHN